MESTYKSVKVEVVYQYQFDKLAQRLLELFDYVHWWNYLRLHGTLAYETPIQIWKKRLAKPTLDNELGSAISGEVAELIDCAYCHIESYPRRLIVEGNLSHNTTASTGRVILK